MFFVCGPMENRTPASAMRMPRNTTLLWALARNRERITHSLFFRATGPYDPRSMCPSEDRNNIPYLVGLPGIEPGLQAPHACVLPVYYSPFECREKRHSGRAAENCTRSTRTRSVCTTGILRPVLLLHALALCKRSESKCAPCKDRTYGLSDVNGTLYH